MSLFNPDLNKELDILSLAMSIEAQALDLYHRAAEKTDDEKMKGAVHQIAKEERAHMAQIADYIEKLA